MPLPARTHTPPLERWVNGVVRRRWLVLAAWLILMIAGALCATRLTPLLATSFAVPGSEAERARVTLASAFDERPEATLTVVFPVADPSDAVTQRAARSRLARAAAAVPTGRAGPLRDGTGLLYGSISTSLELHEAKAYVDDARRALDSGAGPPGMVTGQPAFQHDADPVLETDVRRGQVIALAVALVVLVAVLGLSWAVAVPFLFAAATIAVTLGLVYVLAQATTVAPYVTSLVELIGLGLAIDYSLLVVLRYREELARVGDADVAVVRTMATAGRTAMFSGVAVAIGLALLLLLPVPFVRSMGVGGLLVPVVSIAALLTLQPALLSLLGHRAGARRTATPGAGALWRRLARVTTRRPVLTLALGVGILLAAAAPAFELRLTPGSPSGLPVSLESVRGYERLRKGVGPGVVTPISVVVDTGRAGGARRPDVRAAIDRLGDRLFEDFDLVALGSGNRAPYVDRTRRHARLIAASRYEHGDPRTRAFVQRLRAQDVPAAGFPPDVSIATGGLPPQGVDFLARTYAAFPWLVLAAVAVTYLVLLRAFRSLLVPLKAVILNTLTVAAVYGLLVVVFQWGVGAELAGLHTGPVEGWVPIFLFAVLFGLSMDYEVFVVARMREAWDERPDNARAISRGLERSGVIVTAAAAIMIAAFLGFVVGRFAGLEQLGVGLALGVLLDATLVRCVLVPAAMAALGRYNWWLPTRVARLALVEPSPLVRTGGDR